LNSNTASHSQKLKAVGVFSYDGQIGFENNLPNSDIAWHKKVLNYEKLVDRWTKYFWNINKSYLYSFENLRQTIWYIAMVELKSYDGRGKEEDFLNWYVRNKVISVIMYDKKPPNGTDAPFTPMRFDYVSDEDLTEVSELFYSDGKD
jgi:hypothetical protein